MAGPRSEKSTRPINNRLVNSNRFDVLSGFIHRVWYYGVVCKNREMVIHVPAELKIWHKHIIYYPHLPSPPSLPPRTHLDIKSRPRRACKSHIIIS